MSEERLIANIKWLYKKSQLKQYVFAKKLVISEKTVGHWFNNRSFPSLISMEKISIYYSVSIDDLCRKDISKIPQWKLKNRFYEINEKLIK